MNKAKNNRAYFSTNTNGQQDFQNPQNTEQNNQNGDTTNKSNLDYWMGYKEHTDPSILPNPVARQDSQTINKKVNYEAEAKKKTNSFPRPYIKTVFCTDPQYLGVG